MPAISRDEVAHLARLARLDLSEDELSHYAEQLDVILTAVTRVGEVAAQDVEPMSHPVALDNVFRADAPATRTHRRRGAVGGPCGRGRPFPGPTHPG